MAGGEKSEGERGAAAAFSLNRGQKGSRFHDLPSFETFSQSQTEQTWSRTHEPAFCRLKMASERPGQAVGRQKGSALGRGPHVDSRRDGNGLVYCMVHPGCFIQGHDVASIGLFGAIWANKGQFVEENRRLKFTFVAWLVTMKC